MFNCFRIVEADVCVCKYLPLCTTNANTILHQTKPNRTINKQIDINTKIEENRGIGPKSGG